MRDLNGSLKQRIIPDFSYITAIEQPKIQRVSTNCLATILMISNNFADTKALPIYLKQQGFEVITACNGKLGFEQAQDSQPNLILLEAELDDMNGVEVCRHLKRDKPTKNIPVIFLSASDNIEDKTTAFKAGGIDYITKPFWVEEIFMRINIHISQRHIQQGLEKKIEEQTDNLQAITKNLNKEVTQRRNYEMEKDILLSLLDQQNEQLYLLGQILENTQQGKEINSSISPQTLIDSLTLLQSYIETIQEIFFNEADWQQSVSYEVVVNQLNLALKLVVKIINILPVKSSNKKIDAIKASFSHIELVTQLSSREQQVLNLILMGSSTTEIATKLAVTEATVRTYRHRIMKKLQLKNRDELFRFATVAGLI